MRERKKERERETWNSIPSSPFYTLYICPFSSFCTYFVLMHRHPVLFYQLLFTAFVRLCVQVSLSVRLSEQPFVRSFVRSFIRPFVRLPSVGPSVHQYVYHSVRSVYPFQDVSPLHLSQFVCPTVPDCSVYRPLVISSFCPVH